MINVKKIVSTLLILFLISVFITNAQVSVIGGSGVIKGTVATTEGETLPGATIFLKNTVIGTISDLSGNFLLKGAEPGNYIIRISFQGYAPFVKEITVSADKDVIIEALLEKSVFEMSEVVVTTQKREQTNIEVPVAVSALAGRSLSRLNINEFDALSHYIPGLQMQLQSPNNPGFVIRGITSDDGDSRVQPRVSVFQDGVAISRSRGAVVELFDMERVEVVKGPQGTLFGRSAQIGAVHLIQNKPTQDLSGEIKLGYGNYNQQIVSGFINTPIVKDKLANRFSFSYNKRDGFIDNESGGTLNGKNTIAFRDIIRLTSGKKTVADLILNYQHDDYPGTSFKSGSYAPLNGDIDPNTFADMELGEDLGIKRDVGGATLKINHKLSDNWGLTSISAYRHFIADEAFDADGTVAPALLFNEIAEGTQVSQEIRFNFDNSAKFSGFVGASYFYEDGLQKLPFRTNEQSVYSLLSGIVVNGINANPAIPQAQKEALIGMIYMPLLTDGVPNYMPAIPNIPDVFGPIAGAPLKEYHYEESSNYGTTHAYEIFADGTYNITNNLSITAGIRGTYENLTGAYKSNSAEVPSALGGIIGLYPNIISYPTDEKRSVSKDYFSYVGRVIANYMFDRNNVYASVSRGRRPGVIQISTDLLNASLDTAFLDPEIVWSYEAGIKGVLLDGALAYDLTGYYYDWNHFQTTSYESGLPVTKDVGKAHTFGIETGFRYYFLGRSSFFANYSYIKAEFDDKDADGNEQEYAGNTFRLTPEHSFSAGLDINIPTGDKSMVYFRPSYVFSSKIYFEDNNTDLLSQDDYGLANATAGFVFDNNKMYYQVGLFAKNIFDEKHIIDAGNTGNAFGIPTFIGGSRQTFGLELKIGF